MEVLCAGAGELEPVARHAKLGEQVDRFPNGDLAAQRRIEGAHVGARIRGRAEARAVEAELARRARVTALDGEVPVQCVAGIALERDDVVVTVDTLAVAVRDAGFRRPDGEANVASLLRLCDGGAGDDDDDGGCMDDFLHGCFSGSG